MLPEDIQERYDYLIQYINDLNISDDEKQCLIERIDDVITWLMTAN